MAENTTEWPGEGGVGETILVAAVTITVRQEICPIRAGIETPVLT